MSLSAHYLLPCHFIFTHSYVYYVIINVCFLFRMMLLEEKVTNGYYSHEEINLCPLVISKKRHAKNYTYKDAS